MREDIKIEKLNVNGWTMKKEIYSLTIRTEYRTEYLEINNDSLFPLKEWTIEEAINYYTSEEGKQAKYESYIEAYTE